MILELQPSRRQILTWILQLPLMHFLASCLFANDHPRIIQSALGHKLILPSSLQKTLATHGLSIVGESRYSKADLHFYEKSSKQIPSACLGDFDGDGRTDVALLCESNGHLKIVVAFSRDAGQYEILEINDLGQSSPETPVRYALHSFEAGTIKSHWEDQPLTTTTDSILAEYFEASAWIQYWDGKRFSTYWVAD